MSGGQDGALGPRFLELKEVAPPGVWAPRWLGVGGAGPVLALSRGSIGSWDCRSHAWGASVCGGLAGAPVFQMWRWSPGQAAGTGKQPSLTSKAVL